MSIANELITRGWHQGHYQAEDGSICLRAAARLSVTGTLNSLDRESEVWPSYRSIALALGLTANHPYAPLDDISLWNDTPGRTFDEVLRVAKEADEILAGFGKDTTPLTTSE